MVWTHTLLTASTNTRRGESSKIHHAAPHKNIKRVLSGLPNGVPGSMALGIKVGSTKRAQSVAYFQCSGGCSLQMFGDEVPLLRDVQPPGTATMSAHLHHAPGVSVHV